MPDHFTPRLQLPYPDLDDPADVPADLQQLAERLDTVIPGATLASLPVGDVGMAGQIRAGRQLAVADFTALGLAQPIGLWNLSDLSNLGSDARTLTNKGAVGFAPGINGAAATAAQFTGSASQALYIADSGAADPFRIKSGSWGAWFRTAKRGVTQAILTKYTYTSHGWTLQLNTNNYVRATTSTDGANDAYYDGITDVADDRWHFAVITMDGTFVRIYVDGILETAGQLPGFLFASTAPLNIGGRSADGSASTADPIAGRVDEAFVTADVLSEDQVRGLYCAKIPHTLGVVPSRVSLNVRRRKRGGTLAVADFPAQPLRLYNFTAATFVADEGSNNASLTGNGTVRNASGADGANNTATGMDSGGNLSATDAGLPSGTAARSYGCWFKTTTLANQAVIGWGITGTADARLIITASGVLQHLSGGDTIAGPYAADGQWHHVVAVEDNAAGDGVRRKLYLDGRLVGGGTVLNAITLAGANRFRIGANPDGPAPFTGQIDGAFVCGYALTYEQIAALWAKGSQALPPSPKNPGDHVEAMDAANVYFIGDTLESQHTVDLGVSV